MKTILGAVLAMFFLHQPLLAEAPKVGFVDRVFKDAAGKEFKYVLFVPHAYTGDMEFPLLVYLHGSAGRGDDGKKPATYPLAQNIRKNEKEFPFFAIFPQARETWKGDSDDGKRVIDILDSVVKDYKIDAKRISLTGQSMGGNGTWTIAAKYPDRWAAIVPICGWGDVTTAAVIKDIPCWCFHGDADMSVKVTSSRRMIAALKKAGGSPKYDEYPGVGHNAYDKAYATPELYEWLLKQKRK